MSVWRTASRCSSILILSATAVCAFAQAPSVEYTPEVGQSGKDVVWVPSPQELVDKMLDMAKVTPKDYVIDLGSGDGRTVITAAKRGARALGVEFNPDMVALSRRNAAKAKYRRFRQVFRRHAGVAARNFRNGCRTAVSAPVPCPARPKRRESLYPR